MISKVFDPVSGGVAGIENSDPALSRGGVRASSFGGFGGLDDTTFLQFIPPKNKNSKIHPALLDLQLQDQGLSSATWRISPSTTL